mgnify:FL=1
MVAYKAETVGLQTSRKLIDAIIEVICLVPYEKEDAIQLLVIKVLFTFKIFTKTIPVRLLELARDSSQSEPRPSRPIPSTHV